MKLDLAQVRHVARLARLALTPEEETRYAAQLSAVLEAMEALQSVDTTGVEPTAFTHATLPARSDEVKGELTPEVALANAPQKVGTSFAIPKVIE